MQGACAFEQPARFCAHTHQMSDVDEETAGSYEDGVAEAQEVAKVIAYPHLAHRGFKDALIDFVQLSYLHPSWVELGAICMSETMTDTICYEEPWFSDSMKQIAEHGAAAWIDLPTDDAWSHARCVRQALNVYRCMPEDTAFFDMLQRVTKYHTETPVHSV